MKAIKRLSNITDVVVKLEQLPEGEPSNIVHDIRKVVCVIQKLNKREEALVKELAACHGAITLGIPIEVGSPIELRTRTLLAPSCTICEENDCDGGLEKMTGEPKESTG